MTLVLDTKDPIRHVFALTVSQGLSSADDALPDVPTVADVRRLRRLLPQVWQKLSEGDRREIYEVFSRLLTSSVPPLKALSALPQTLRAMRLLIQREGLEGAVRHARVLDTEVRALQQEVISLWENDQPAFQARVEAAVLVSRHDRGARVRTRSDVRAALDELF